MANTDVMSRFYDGVNAGNLGIIDELCAFPDLRLQGMAPTGRRIDVPCADIVRFRDGLAVEHWGVTDSGVMMQQLGAAPPG